jgi:hypothetical protein
MPHYDGVVTIADDDFPVIVEFDDDLIRLSASGTEIGQWNADDCEITRVADSTYMIKAENEVLEFVPSQPGLFAAALTGDRIPTVADAPQAEKDSPEAQIDPMAEAPPPKPLTVGLFYGLCAITAALALWSLISLIL